MTQLYNPIVRHFGLLRGSLIRATGRERHDLRPSTPLADLFPAANRRAMWQELQREWPELGNLSLPSPLKIVIFWAAPLGAILLALVLWQATALLAMVELGFLLFKASRPRAVEFPTGLTTVGDLAICLIRFRDFRDSGYCWTRNELSLQVRMIIARHLMARIEAVKPETTFAELGVD